MDRETPFMTLAVATLIYVIHKTLQIHAINFPTACAVFVQNVAIPTIRASSPVIRGAVEIQIATAMVCVIMKQ
jgi:hypothetical protein